MHHFICRSALALSTLIGGVALSGQAQAASLWHNYASNQCLGISSPSKEGAVLTVQTCPPPQLQTTNQLWDVIADPVHPGYFNIFSIINFLPPHVRQLIGVQAAQMTNGKPLIVWRPTGEVNQAWSEYAAGFTDAAGHPCVSFHDADNPAADMAMSVSGSAVVIRTFTGARDQYWCQY